LPAPADVSILAVKLPKVRIGINHAANLRIDGKTPPVKWREGMEAAAASNSGRSRPMARSWRTCAHAA
jgi:hypothetical protein